MSRARSTKGAFWLAPVAVLGLAAASALAADPADPSPDPPAAPAAEPPDAGAPSAWASCVEHLPEGATRPKMVERFPDRGMSGYAQTLEVTVTHGKGETVLPGGFKVQRSSDAARALEQSGFVIPEVDGGSSPSLSVADGETSSTTTVTMPFVPLPKEPGRHRLVLPRIPITMARASGEIVTLCTDPHILVVEDPIANEADPKVKPNPEPRRQREEWVLAKQLTMGALAGLALGVVIGWLVRRWMRRPKVVYVPPPKLPWVAALEELEVIRRSHLLADAQTGEYFDRVSDCVRKYLGARYGFDGLESTTDEMRVLLKRVRPRVGELKRISDFLADCDLVKFARMVPSEQDCLDALSTGEQIVHRTTPHRTIGQIDASAEEGDAL